MPFSRSIHEALYNIMLLYKGSMAYIPVGHTSYWLYFAVSFHQLQQLIHRLAIVRALCLFLLYLLADNA